MSKSEQVSPKSKKLLDLVEAQVGEPLPEVTGEDGEIQVNGRTMSLDDAFPLSIGDWCVLEEKKLLGTKASVALLDVDGTTKFLLYLFQKVDSRVTSSDLDKISLQKANRLFLFVQKKMEEEDKDLNPTKSNF